MFQLSNHANAIPSTFYLAYKDTRANIVDKRNLNYKLIEELLFFDDLILQSKAYNFQANIK